MMMINNPITMIHADETSLKAKANIEEVKEEIQELYDRMKQAWDVRSLDGMEIKSKKEIQEFCSKAEEWVSQQIISCNARLNAIESAIQTFPACEALYEEHSSYDSLRQYLQIYAEECNQLLNMSHQLALLDTKSTESGTSQEFKDSPFSYYTSLTP